MRLCTGRVAIVHMNADAPIFVQKRVSAHFYRRLSSRRRRRLSRRLLQKALRRRDFFREGPQTDTIMAGLGILLVLTACWRVVGPPIVIIAVCFILYGLAGSRGAIHLAMPGFLAQRGYHLPRIITHLFITTEGVIGNPIGVCSTYIFLFIMFGACL